MIADKLKAVNRVRKIIESIDIAINDLEQTKHCLENYPAMETKDDKIVLIG